MPVRPMLGDVELQQVQKIEVDEDQVLVQHSIPALEGDFFQLPGRRATKVALTGVLTGPEVSQGLATWREKFRAAQPLPFVADITTSTKVNQVVIEELGVRELAGKPERFEYALTLREYIPPPKVEREAPPPPPPIPPPPPVDKGTLIVEVMMAGQPDFDYNTVTVTAEGTQQDGALLTRTLKNQSPTWTEENMPPGQYTARAIVTEPSSLASAVETAVQAGQTTKVTLTLQPTRPANVAIGFMVHFGSDKAFLEPCMRHVLWKVKDYARSHQNEKLVIVGNTDRRGSDEYNLSLGDRRARSVYAYLTCGRNATAREDALEDWKLLRQKPDYRLPSVKDNWGTRQYQYMLQNRGYYPSNVDGQHGPMTHQAVQDFQQDHQLPPTGQMDDATWEELIKAYLFQDEAVMDTLENQFLENCPGEILKWLACGEQHPRKTTPAAPCAPDIAWRPNRRTELLFVCTNTLPSKGQEPKPVTFDLPEDRPVGKQWCLGPDADPTHQTPRCSFLKEEENCPPTSPNQWCVQPATTGTIPVSGSIKDENGNPLGGWKYVLIAPDGKFMDGEKPCGEDRGRPVLGKTLADGTFSYSEQTPVGIYTIEVELPQGEPHIAYDAKRPPATGRGSVVCKWLDASEPVFDVIVQAGSASRETIKPVIKLASQLVVVKKSYTNPARQPVTLTTDPPTFDKTGKGKFTRSSPAICFFTAPVGGTEITFNGTDNVFSGDQLSQGVQLFAEGASPSADPYDVQITLSLSSPDLLVGPPAFANMTSVELTLDICDRRTSPGIDPLPLSTKDKIDPGRFLEVHNSNYTHERAMLIVRRAKPEALAHDLVLVPLNTQVQLYQETEEIPQPQQQPLPTPLKIFNGTIPPNGKRFWVEGASVSSKVRDTGFQLGLSLVENDGDRVAITIFTFSLRVEGASHVGGGNSTTYVTDRLAGRAVTIIADIIPHPSPVPSDFIQWSGGEQTTDPLRRTVSRTHDGSQTISATFAGITKSATIVVRYHFLVVGHRGSPIKQVENTIPAYQEAINVDGVNGLEIDLCLTRDQEVIVWHDWDPNSSEALVRQQGLEPVGFKPVVPLAESSWRRTTNQLLLEEFRQHYGYAHIDTGISVQTHIPTFEEFIKWAREKPNLLYVFLDMKIPKGEVALVPTMMTRIDQIMNTYRPNFTVVFLTPEEVIHDAMKRFAPQYLYSLDVQVKVVIPIITPILFPTFSGVQKAIEKRNTFATDGRPAIGIAKGDFYRRVIDYDVQLRDTHNANPANQPVDKLVGWTVDDEKEMQYLVGDPKTRRADGLLSNRPDKLRFYALNAGQRVDL